LISSPGSHDSLSYSIKNDAPLSPDAEPEVKSLEKAFGCLMRRIMHRWCVTQKYTITEQLNLGIRFFDFRVSVKVEDDNFYFVHGMYGEEINGPLNDILRFLQDRDNEIAILDFQHFYALGPQEHMRLIGLLKDVFCPAICPLPDNIADVTLAWMKQKGYKVIIIYRDKSCLGDVCLWPSKRWPTPWPETMSPATLINFLESGTKTRPTNCGYVSQCLLTPTKSTVATHVFSDIRKKCARPAALVTIPWLESKHDGCINVAIADFVEDNDGIFPRTVVSLNKTSK
ncbi:hypothetical protein AAG570_003611, partial [Ranatra chinensis]